MRPPSRTRGRRAWTESGGSCRCLLPVSTVLGLVAPTAPHAWARFELGLPVVVAAAVWWSVVTARFRRNASGWGVPAILAVHTVLAGVLVWVNTAYGVFAYTGFLFAYGLGRPVAGGRLRGDGAHRRGGSVGRVPVEERGADSLLPSDRWCSPRARAQLRVHQDRAHDGAEPGSRADDRRVGRGQASAWSPPWRRTPSCTPGWSNRPASRASSRSADGSPGRSTTPWPRG